MKGSLSRIAILTILSLSLGCGGGDKGSGGGADKAVKLKVVSFYPEDLPIIGETLVRFRGRVGTASSGSIGVKVFEPGELVQGSEILDAVSSGKVDAGYCASGLWMGKMPAAPLFSSVPFGPGLGEYLAWFYEGNGMELYQQMYDDAGFNVKVLILAMLPPETSGWFANEIKTVEDLNGLKMRFFGLGGSVLEKLGVSVSSDISSPEIYPAIEKKILDATEYSMPVIDESLQLYKLVKYNYYPGWHQQTTALELIINKDVWNSLSPAQQAVIEISCRDGVTFSAARGDGAQSAVMRRNVEEHGVINAQWPPELMAAFKEKWGEVVEEQSAADPFFKTVWDDLQEFRKEYQQWRQLGYLKEDSDS